MKDIPHNLTKYEIKETSKISISQLFSELGNMWKYGLFKNPNFQTLCEMEKTWKYSLKPRF